MAVMQGDPCSALPRKTSRCRGVDYGKEPMPKRRMTGMKQSVPKSVDEYMAAQPEAVRPKLEQVRAAIRRAVPGAVEGIGYRMPGYKLHGKPSSISPGSRNTIR